MAVHHEAKMVKVCLDPQISWEKTPTFAKFRKTYLYAFFQSTGVLQNRCSLDHTANKIRSDLAVIHIDKYIRPILDAKYLNFPTYSRGMKVACMYSSISRKFLLTLILLELKVICLCHQYRARPTCMNKSDQALYCRLTNFKLSS